MNNYEKMNLSNVKLPSNKKFGFFFASIFFVAAAYSFYVNGNLLMYILCAISIIFFVVTVIKADILLPLNKLWMRFGFLLGMIISPIVMGTIFFVLLTPIALVTRLFGRDELYLLFNKRKSHWVSRETVADYDSFKNQF